MTDKELDALLMVLRNGSTQMSRLNLHEARQVFRFAESQGYTIGVPKTSADSDVA